MKRDGHRLDDVGGLQRRHKLLQLLDLSGLVDAAVELSHRVAEVAEHELPQATVDSQQTCNIKPKETYRRGAMTLVIESAPSPEEDEED